MENADLRRAWRALAGTGERAGAVGAELLGRWSGPDRHYHGPDHLRAVLAGVDALAGEAADADLVRFAAWFHDAVYDGVPGRDEERSAALAERLVPECGRSAEFAAEVGRLVRVTAGHRPAPGDTDAEVLCDADLAVLGRDPEGYREYAAAVRREYAHVGEADFRAGRAAVLRGLLAADPLFRTAAGRARWEAAARRNMAGELAALGGEPPPLAPPQA
ncbi:putative metal-dependent HD superfamily phosphohydrolase [Nocardiopsis composta]|uniref:Putative metal-dependent HD superfamily phosphohydrolase n=1 Tax=Nocardiopsis composta TaxID=157465 RepID=A0A7W8VD99_9ACTN|nr:putative metal-dependent HD superfamily phosphohydrolase [Nocardiopsis composta]